MYAFGLLLVALADAAAPPIVIEGWGKNTVGGTGGVTYWVTTLTDGGSGSLREAVEASGPRIVRFAVSGYMKIDHYLIISNPYITIDGSDAPNQGVAIRHSPIIVQTDEVIVRYLRFRPGSEGGDGFLFRWGRNLVMDHCSLAWSTDELLDIGFASGPGAAYVTIQHSILSEPLHCSSHMEEGLCQCHGKACLVLEHADNMTFHHNLFVHNDDRNPTVQNGHIDFVNNIVYNYGTGGPTKSQPDWAPVHFNIEYNFYKKGKNSNNYAVRLQQRSYGTVSTQWIRGNISPLRPTDTGDDWLITPDAANGNRLTARSYSWQINSMTDATTAYNDVLANVGVLYPCRDAIELRALSDTSNGVGKFVNDPEDVGGWPDLTQPCGVTRYLNLTTRYVCVNATPSKTPLTPSDSATKTPTRSPSKSRSFSKSPSKSKGATASSSTTRTSTRSATSSKGASLTRSVTNSVSPTESLSEGASPSLSASVSESETASPSPAGNDTDPIASPDALVPVPSPTPDSTDKVGLGVGLTFGLLALLALLVALYFCLRKRKRGKGGKKKKGASSSSSSSSSSTTSTTTTSDTTATTAVANTAVMSTALASTATTVRSPATAGKLGKTPKKAKASTVSSTDGTTATSATDASAVTAPAAPAAAGAAAGAAAAAQPAATTAPAAASKNKGGSTTSSSSS